MRKTLTTLLILTSVYAFACTCHLADIKKSYTYSSAIFYGKYLSTDTLENFNDILGRPFIVDNFEVTKFYRGVDSSTFNYYKNKNHKYTISLINSCNDDCGICFEKNQMYLVYAYRDFYSGNLTTDGCTRTRKIIDKNFFPAVSFDPDLGQDEDRVLENLRLNDTTEKNFGQFENEFNFQKELLNSQLVDTDSKLKSTINWLYLVSAVSLTVILLLVYKLRQKS